MAGGPPGGLPEARAESPEGSTRVRGRFEERRRRWRHLPIWGHTSCLEGPIRRLPCPTCETVRTEEVPWARYGSSFTRPFEDVVGLLAQKLNHTDVAQLTGIAWVAVGSIARRLVDGKLDEDRFHDLRRIGMDRFSYRRHHRYLTVVVDHDREQVVWAGEGKFAKTVLDFFQGLGPVRAPALQLVSIDMSAAYDKAAGSCSSGRRKPSSPPSRR